MFTGLLWKLGAAAMLLLGLLWGFNAMQDRAYQHGLDKGRADAAQQARVDEKRWQQEKDDAVNAQLKRVAALQAGIAGLRADADGLRNDLSVARARIKTASDAAVAEYADTATAVLGECESRYSEVAGQAQGHADDVESLLAAWPK